MTEQPKKVYKTTIAMGNFDADGFKKMTEEMNKEDKQDWKEKFVKWYLGKSPQVVMNWIEENVIQPLQSKNDILQKQVEHLKGLGNEFIDEKEALQKEVDSLKEVLKNYMDVELHEYAQELGIDEQTEKEVVAMADRAIAKVDADKKYVAGLQKENQELKEALKYLMEGVEGLPPLTAIQGTLIHHFEVAKKALKINV